MIMSQMWLTAALRSLDPAVRAEAQCPKVLRMLATRSRGSSLVSAVAATINRASASRVIVAACWLPA